MPVKVTLNTRRLDAIVAGMDSRADDIVQEAGRDLAARVQNTIAEMGAVDTGNLYRSVEYQPEGSRRGGVFVRAPYARFVHEGHHTRGGSWVAGRPFVRVAVEHFREEFFASFRRLFE